MVKRIVTIILSFFLLANITLAQKINNQQIVATTSLIASIVEVVMPAQIKTSLIIPAGMCPGHFDLSPAVAKKIEAADLIFMQGIPGEKMLAKIIHKIASPSAQIIVSKTKGNWMLPHVYLKASSEISHLLAKNYPDMRHQILRNQQQYQLKISSILDKLQPKISYIRESNVAVIASFRQKDFLQWLGLKVVATYPRPEKITPQQIKTIIDIAKQKNAMLVIDNLQSAAGFGSVFSRELGIGHLIITNFPQANKQQHRYLSSLSENINKIFHSVKEINES
jgi:ABC-type Zn uptake system ZnuABC Zn-binding protein ZnuA